MKMAFSHLCSSLFRSRGGRFRGSRPHFWGPDILLSLLGDLKGCRFLWQLQGDKVPRAELPRKLESPLGCTRKGVISVGS